MGIRECLLYPRKRTSSAPEAMSALCHQQTLRPCPAGSVQDARGVPGRVDQPTKPWKAEGISLAPPQVLPKPFQDNGLPGTSCADPALFARKWVRWFPFPNGILQVIGSTSA